VEAFDLAGGRAADPGEPVGDPLFPADAVEHHLTPTGMGAEPTGEHLAVVGQQQVTFGGPPPREL
jgi:hypothetical protein